MLLEPVVCVKSISNCVELIYSNNEVSCAKCLDNGKEGGGYILSTDNK